MLRDRCRELTDTKFVCLSGNGENIDSTDSELAISISVSTPDESDKLHEMLNTDAGRIVLEFVALPFGSGCSVKDYHTAGRNVFFLPQTKTDINDETAYYEHCVSEAVSCITLLKRVTDNMESYDNFISFDISDFIKLLNSCENSSCKFMIYVEDDFDSCINALKNHSLINSDTAAIMIMAFLPKTTLVADWDRLSEITQHDEKVLMGAAFVDDTDKAEFIALVVNRI